MIIELHDPLRGGAPEWVLLELQGKIAAAGAFDGRLVGRIKANALRQLKNSGHGRLEALDAAMGNGHAVAQTGRAQTLSRKQAVCDQRPRKTMQILKQQARLFKSALLAGGVNAHQNLFNGKDVCKSVHIEGGLCTHVRGNPNKKTAP
jgi:hypothetical protein